MQDLDRGVLNLGFELRQLHFARRSGWHHIRIDPENVAEHSHRAAVLGYLLAHLENFPKPELVATMLIFHDMQETRTHDPDLVTKQYVKVDKQAALHDQTEALGAVRDSIRQMWSEVNETNTVAGQIADDADMLEMAMTARELIVDGKADAAPWIDAAGERIQTESGKRLLALLRSANPNEWWESLFNGGYYRHDQQKATE